MPFILLFSHIIQDLMKILDYLLGLIKKVFILIHNFGIITWLISVLCLLLILLNIKINLIVLNFALIYQLQVKIMLLHLINLLLMNLTNSKH